jgi:hypothetical protein
MARTEVTGKQIKDKSVSLTDDVVDVLPVANGGTGSDTLAVGNVLVGNGTGALQSVAPGTTGYVLTSNGSSWVAAEPTGQPDQLFSGSTNVDRDLMIGDGPQQFGHKVDYEPWAENQYVSFADQTAGSDLIYFGRLRIQFAGGFGWAFGLHEILSVTGTTYNDTSAVWLMSFVAAPQVEVTARRGQPDGYASLDGDGLVPLIQLPADIGGGIDSVAVENDSLQFYNGTTPVGSPISLLVAAVDGGSPSTVTGAFIDGGLI